MRLSDVRKRTAMVDVSAVGLTLGFCVGMVFNLPGPSLMVLVTAC